jgi:hypothetical protein
MATMKAVIRRTGLFRIRRGLGIDSSNREQQGTVFTTPENERPGLSGTEEDGVIQPTCKERKSLQA